MGKRFLEAGQAKDVGGHGGLAFIVLAYPSAESYNSTAREGHSTTSPTGGGHPSKASNVALRGFMGSHRPYAQSSREGIFFQIANMRGQAK